MKKYPYLSILLLASVVLLSSCEAIAGIFKAGMWTGVIGVVLFVALIIFVITRIGGKK